MINGDLHKLIYINLDENISIKNRNPRPAMFLDRDGVILKECNHLSNPNKVKLENGVKKLMEFLSFEGVPIIIITNQSGIYKGDYSWQDYEKVTERMISLLGDSVKITAIYANGEDREKSNLKWRKPSPKMLTLAKEECNIELKNSFLIGDRLSDLKCGLNAHIKNLIHVMTGHGEKERELIINYFKKINNTKLQIKDSNLILIKTIEEISLSFLKKNLN